ncbi:MAG: DUF2628 domain-containing protein [Clostridia bacterium]|nr:DUF2628 domain-containing protein [Clostridia bacterium]
MNYENHSCPYCGKPLRAEDDVVVCPVCATPQHRECWMENGHCANDSLHAEGYVWNGREKSQPVAEASPAGDTGICHICGSENPSDVLHCGNCGALFGEKTSDSSQNKICAFCGKENDDDARHCKNCGAPLGKDSSFFNENPYLAGTGINSEDLIGGMKSGDIALYTQSNSKKYLPKFKRFAKGKKLSFNFAAFFFAPYWFFFRKLYKAGIFFMVLFATASLMLSGFSNELAVNSNEYAEIIYNFDIENATEEEIAAFEKEAEKAGMEFFEKSKKPLLIISGVTLLLNLICALTADRLYYKKLKDDMKLLDESFKEPNMRKMMISRRGGISPLAFAVSIMGYNSLVRFLIMGADIIMNNF